MPVTLGTGITITFDSGFFAEIVDVEWSEMTRGAIDSSHMGTTAARTFVPTALFDPGGLNVEMHFIPATRPPIDDPIGTLTIDYGSHSWACQAFMTGFQIQAPFEDKQVATANLKFSGNITIT